MEEILPKHEQGFKLACVYFLVQGIGTLMPWNAIITGLDFFVDSYGQNVDFTFPFANQLPLLICPFILVYLEKRLHVNTRIAVFTALMGIMMILLPVITTLFPNTTGLWMIYTCLFFLGVFNVVSQASVAGLAGYFPSECLAYETTGYGIAGILIIGLRAICLLIFPENREGNLLGILVYYAAAGIFIFSCIIVHFKFINTEYAKKMISKRKEFGPEASDSENINEISQDLCESEENVGKSKNVNPVKDFLFMLKVGLEIKWFVIMIFFVMMQTFMLFPGVTLLRTTPFSSSWQTVIMVAIFNCCDTFGKYLSIFRKFYNFSFAMMNIFLRFIFYFTFIIQIVQPNFPVTNSLTFCFVNLGLFGLSNGFGNGSVFVLAPEAVKGYKKEVSGFLMVTVLNLGILAGSSLALLFSNLGPTQ